MNAGGGCYIYVETSDQTLTVGIQDFDETTIGSVKDQIFEMAGEYYTHKITSYWLEKSLGLTVTNFRIQIIEA